MKKVIFFLSVVVFVINTTNVFAQGQEPVILTNPWDIVDNALVYPQVTENQNFFLVNNINTHDETGNIGPKPTCLLADDEFDMFITFICPFPSDGSPTTGVLIEIKNLDPGLLLRIQVIDKVTMQQFSCGSAQGDGNQIYTGGLIPGRQYVVKVVDDFFDAENDTGNWEVSIRSLVSLPVEMGDIELTEVQDGVRVNFFTYAEINNDHFELQYSKDRVYWISSGIIVGAGDSNEILDYEYLYRLHNNDKVSTMYFRIKQVDFNGRFEIFDAGAITFRNQRADISVITPEYPHSVRINTKFMDRNEPITALVYDMNGHMTHQFELVDGIQDYTITLASGMNIFRFIDDRGVAVKTQKVVNSY